MPPVSADPVDTLVTLARVPVDVSVPALPEALLTLPPQTVIEGTVTPLPDQAQPTITTEFGSLSVTTATPLPDGRVVSLQVPLVVRLEGTNVDLGKKILSESGLPIVSSDDLADAAEKIVHEVKEVA